MRLKHVLLPLLIIFPLAISLPQFSHKNIGISQSKGSVNKGSLTRAYKLNYKTKNYKYYSPFSYFLLGRCYVHSSLYKTINSSYQQMNAKYPDYIFRVMDSSTKKGGKMFPHQTHQNGLSVDFMTPLQKNDKHYKLYDRIGILRYAINFNSKGRLRLNSKVEIDFEMMAQHILLLDAAARENGLYVKKVILKTNLKDDLFATKSGKQIKQKGIYFARYLPPGIDKLHDDHYHIDFGFL